MEKKKDVNPIQDKPRLFECLTFTHSTYPYPKKRTTKTKTKDNTNTRKGEKERSMCKIFEKKQNDNHEDYTNCVEEVLLYIPENEYSVPLIRHDELAAILDIDEQQLRGVLMQNYRNDFDLYCLVQNGEYEWRIYRENFQLTMDMESFVAITLDNIGIVEKLFASASDEIKKKLEDIKWSLENYTI